MTILGLPTVAELRDLVKNKDVQLMGLSNDYLAFVATWAAKDASGQQAWYKDYMALVQRYNEARKAAQFVLDKSANLLTSETVTPAGPAWDGILRALQKIEGSKSTGDFLDLRERLTQAGAAQSNVPNIQPRAGTDADLNMMRAADTAIADIEAGAKKASGFTLKTGLGIAAGVGGVILLAEYLKRKL